MTLEPQNGGESSSCQFLFLFLFLNLKPWCFNRAAKPVLMAVSANMLYFSPSVTETRVENINLIYIFQYCTASFFNLFALLVERGCVGDLAMAS